MSAPTAAIPPATCCGRKDGGGCVCAQEARCSCGKQPAMQCNCERAATENKVVGAACSCSMYSSFCWDLRDYFAYLCLLRLVESPQNKANANEYQIFRSASGQDVHMLASCPRERRDRRDVCLWKATKQYVLCPSSRNIFSVLASLADDLCVCIDSCNCAGVETGKTLPTETDFTHSK